ncbi:MAG: hypothetical protein EPN26_14275 [Rhodospirillales bacterium]|nr:MAG: hypothetical protein EPN26_14275 [Rhodospirillales bacterium]
MKAAFNRAVLLAGAAMLASCVTVPEVGGLKGPGTGPGAAAPSEPLPHFVIGESFHFDDGRSETVVGVDGDLVTWRTSNGVTRTAYKNAMLPYLEWWDSSSSGKIQQTDLKPTTLWPPVPGLHTRFYLVMTEILPGKAEQRYTQDWECKVEGTGKTTVPAGTFDTRKVACYRTYYGYLRQTRIFNFAPALGYYVSRHDESVSSGTSARKLTAHEYDTKALSDAERNALVAQVQNALSKSPDGKPVTWQDSKKQIAVQIVPVSTDNSGPKGAKCRVYDGVFNVGGKTLTNRRKACQGKKGEWLQS